MITHNIINKKLEIALEDVFKCCAVIRQWKSEWEVEYHQEIERFDHHNETFKKVFNELVAQAKYFYDVNVAEVVKKSCKQRVDKLHSFNYDLYEDGAAGYEIGDCILADHADLDELDFGPLQKVMDDCKLAQFIPFFLA